MPITTGVGALGRPLAVVEDPPGDAPLGRPPAQLLEHGKRSVGRGAAGEALEVPEPGVGRPRVDGVRRAELLLAVGAELVVGAGWPEVELAGTTATGQDPEAVVGAEHLDGQALVPGRAATPRPPARCRRWTPVGSSVCRP